MTLDELIVVIRAQTGDFKREIAGVNSELEGMGKQASQKTAIMGGAFDKVGKAATTALKVGVVGAIGAVAASIPGAVKRIDTLVAFPRVLEAMGASSEEAAKATDTLATRLQGLPTPLQDGAAGVQALVSAGLKVGDATDVFLAFNNATLAASTEAGAAQGAFTQLVQSISKGKIEGQEWNSIVSAMPTAFQALSKESGMTREELRELYRTDPQKLLDDLVKLNEVGGGGLASLEEQARAATGGIGTSFQNMKNAITRGIQGIVAALGNGDLEAGQRKISDAVTAMGQAFGTALAKVGELVAFIAANGPVFGTLAATIGGMVAVITAWHIITQLMTVAQTLFNAVLAANPIGLVVVAIAGLVAGLAYFVTQTETGRKIFAVAMEAIKTAAIATWNAIKSAWSAVTGFFSGIFNTVKAVATAVMGVVSAVFGTAWATIRGVWSPASGFFSGIGNAIRSAMSTAASVAQSMMSNAWSVVRGVWSAASGFFSGVASSIRGAMSGIPGALGSIFQSAWNQITSIFGRIGSWFSGLSGQMASAGRAMIQGLVGGLDPGPVIERMKSIASSAIDTVKSFLGIKSPSRVMAQIGRQMNQGWSVGLDGSANLAVNSADKSAHKVLGAFTGIRGTANLGVVGAVGNVAGQVNARPQHVTVKIGEDTIIDRVVSGINTKSFMNNGIVLDL